MFNVEKPSLISLLFAKKKQPSAGHHVGNLRFCVVPVVGEQQQHTLILFVTIGNNSKAAACLGVNKL